jgi:hypothetical protein
MLKVYITKKVRSYCIKEYASGTILHDYFASEKAARDFIRDLRLNYTIVKKPREYFDPFGN